MANSIFLLDSSDSLRELRETPYDSEALLQGLLAKYPQLLGGEQMDSTEPRRWLLIAREAGLSNDDFTSSRWSVDHLFVDQDAIPTIVEVKRSSDTRIRREVVGQMLDYAANAVLYWQIDRLRTMFETRCSQTGQTAEKVLDEFLEDFEPAKFWDDLKTNLQAGRLRLVFVADEIPRELQRIVEFLNAQMDPTEVLAVEVRRFSGDGVDTLVPRVLGVTSQSQSKKSADHSLSVGNRSMFAGTTLEIAPHVKGNPRRPGTHGWLAFEVLRRGGGRMTFEEYEKRLRQPSPDIAQLAATIPGEKNGYQHFRHVRHDVRAGRILVNGKAWTSGSEEDDGEERLSN